MNATEIHVTLRPAWCLPAVALVAVTGLEFPGDAAAAETPSYSREVRPILSDKCFKCHGFDDKTREAGLRLDTREGALQLLESGSQAIVPGDLEDSELVHRITTEDEDDLMPPASAKKPLTEAERAILKAWVAGGAEYEEHWAFLAPVKPAPPEVPKDHAGWTRNPIDRFVVDRLVEAGLEPSSEADRHTLVRRLHLDLIGLPPTPEEADEFVHDTRPDAYERLVERLLASPHYGERWARRWLDLARYADTNGYEKDRARSIWPFRDWVIGALNDDLPFDQFTVKQIAGDMLPDATLEDMVATGFHRNTMINEEGGIDPLEFRYRAVVDRVNTTATAWMGLTMECAQCHTHKYDPISHTEYFRVMAFLNNADEPDLEVPTDEILARRAAIEEQAKALEASLADRFPIPEEGVEWRVVRPEGVLAEGAEVTLEDDGRVRFGGPAPEVDRYTIDFRTEGGQGFDRLRVEALAGPGNRGPGRTSHGNFVLSEVEVLARVEGSGREWAAVPLRGASADVEQPGFPASQAVDGRPETGWAIDADPEGRHQDRSLVARLEDPGAGDGSIVHWRVVLDQRHGGAHTIAALRLSLGRTITAKPAGGGEPAPAEERRREALASAFGKWVETESAKARHWSVVTPSEASANLPRLEILEDGSVLASGDQTKSDTYRLEFDGPLRGVTAIRLEALPHESLPKRGPGRAYYEGPKGDFFLSEFRLASGGSPVPFSGASHDYAKLGIGGARSAADLAIDGNPQTGWSTSGREGEAHRAVFTLAEPLDAPDGLALEMLFERHYSVGLGRFRIAVTTDPRPAAASDHTAAIEAILAKAEDARTPEERGTLLARFLEVAPELESARAEIAALRATKPAVTTTLAMRERPADNPRPTFRHHRGEFLQAEEQVHPGVPAAFPGLPSDARPDRLAFARWLVSRSHPLTARVTVNRHWHAFFGRGIVATLEDFGLQGGWPSHPDLLDWLAVEFMDRGWSMKELHRLIVTSATYRQSSHVTRDHAERDPENVLLARGPRFRMEAEMVRDAALAATGLLTPTIGGPSVFPPQPASVTTEGTYGALPWTTSTGPDRYRRSLYTYAKRTAPFAMLQTFGAPSGEACVARREESNTPLQALTLLNDDMFHEMARHLGGLVAANAASPDRDRVVDVFRRFLTRPPTEDETGRLLAFVEAQRKRFSGGDPAADAGAFAGEGEGDPVERAAWTALVRAVMNLHEAVVKA